MPLRSVALCALAAAAAAQPLPIPAIGEPVVRAALDNFVELEFHRPALSDEEWHAVDTCVLSQSPAQAALGTLKLFEIYMGPAANASRAHKEYNAALVSPFTGVDENNPSPNSLAPTIGSYSGCKAANGQFCYAPIKPGQPVNLVWFSVCVPQACDAEVATTAVTALLPMVTALTNGLVCADLDEPSFEHDTGAQGTAAALSILCAIAVVSTLVYQGYMMYATAKAQEQTEADEKTPIADAEAGKPATGEKTAPVVVKAPQGGLLSFCACWDIMVSLEQLFNIPEKKRPTDFLNGMRFFSILWVVLGHVCVYAQLDAPGLDNGGEMANYTKSYRDVLLTSAWLAVDTFFFMSGFLACYLFLGAKAKRAWPEDFSVGVTARNLGFTWLGRYIRLTPLYACVLFGNLYLLEYMSTGPFRALNHHGSFSGTGCEDYWYLNLLYVQNLFPASDIAKEYCLGHSWYLANDFQFLIVGSFLMVGYVYRPKIAVVLTALLMCVTWGFDIAFMSDRANINNMGMMNYNKPYIRGAPYLYGLLAGYTFAVHHATCAKITGDLKKRLGLYAFATIIMWGTISVTWAAYAQGVPVPSWSLAEARAYQFLYHFGWGLGLSVLAIVWGCGHGGLVSGFLSLPVFGPLAKMTFGVYLLHPTILTIAHTATTAGGNANHYSDVWLLVNWTAVAFGAHIAGAITYVFIERPTSATYQWLLKGGWRSPKERKVASEF